MLIKNKLLDFLRYPEKVFKMLSIIFSILIIILMYYSDIESNILILSHVVPVILLYLWIRNKNSE